MLKNAVDQKTSHLTFVANVVATQTVWVLEDDDGCAILDSDMHETKDGEPEIILCYWSDETLARACAKTHWPDHTLSEISLSDFMENWCVGMQSDGVLAGTDFDRELIGTEVLPLDLLLDIFEALDKNNKKMNFEHYPSQEDFKQLALDTKNGTETQ